MIRFLIRVIWALFGSLFCGLYLIALLVLALFLGGKTGSGIDGVSAAQAVCHPGRCLLHPEMVLC